MMVSPFCSQLLSMKLQLLAMARFMIFVTVSMLSATQASKTYQEVLQEG